MKAHLMDRCAVTFPARIDGWRLVYGLEPPPVEKALAHEIEQAEDGKFDTVRLGRDADQDIGDHGRDNLQADGVLIVADEGADAQVLLHPAEEQLDLPAGLVKLADGNRLAFEIVARADIHRRLLTKS